MRGIALGSFLQLLLNASYLIGMVGFAVANIGFDFLGWQIMAQCSSQGGLSVRRVTLEAIPP